MLYGRVYISRQSSDSKTYKDGMFYRTALITNIDSDEFIQLCDKFTKVKPIYGMVVDRRAIHEGTLLGKFNTECHDSDNIVLLPFGINTKYITIKKGVKDYSGKQINNNIPITEYKLYDSSNNRGYVSSALISNPLDLFKHKGIATLYNNVAQPKDISQALWSLRTKIKILNIEMYNKN